MVNSRISLVQDIVSPTGVMGDPNKLFMVCDFPDPLNPNSKIVAELVDRPILNDCHSENNAGLPELSNAKLLKLCPFGVSRILSNLNVHLLFNSYLILVLRF